MAIAADVLVVDPDRDTRDALALALTRAGFRLGCFAGVEGVEVSVRTSPPACMLIAIGDDGSRGLVDRLLSDAPGVPLLVICAPDDLTPALEAIGRGVRDYVERPIQAEEAIARVQRALVQRPVRAQHDLSETDTLHLDLTDREREILIEIAEGSSSKEIGRRLKISPRTVEVHRSRILDKLGAKNTAELMRILLLPRRA